MKSRRKPLHSNRERWLVSYADFITLLFAFFVVLYASAQVDKRRVTELSAAIQSAFQELGPFPQGSAGGSTPKEQFVDKPRVESSAGGDFTKLENDLKHALARQIERQDVTVYVGSEGLVLSLREAGFFDSASERLRPEGYAGLREVVKVLSEQSHALRIEGHTDNVPIHNSRFASNWELSTARATEIVRFLITEQNFPPERLSAAGYAEFHPVADNLTEEGRRKNRRVDIIVLREGPQSLAISDDKQ